MTIRAARANAGEGKHEPASRALRPAESSPLESSGISDELFARFQSLIYRETGIWLARHKTSLLTGRLSRRLRALGLPTMLQYYRLVTQPDQQAERERMIDCITTNETHFFREPRHFEFLAQQLFPRWKREAATGQRAPRVRIWSAGCSSGEEAYSLAMMLRKYFPAEAGWDVEVLATDISTRVLEKARTAIFPEERSRQIPKDYLRAYALKGIRDQEGFIKIAPEIQGLVRFLRVNLHSGAYPFAGLFDLIFCRNVLIYFDRDSKNKAAAGLLRHLAPSGLLVVGHSENLHGTAGLRTVLPTIYTHAEQPSELSRSGRSVSADYPQA